MTARQIIQRVLRRPERPVEVLILELDVKPVHALDDSECPDPRFPRPARSTP